MPTSTPTTSADKIGASTHSNDSVAASTHGSLNPDNSAKPHSEPNFLHSPPDSNNLAKSDGSDSELSDLEDEPILSDAPQPAAELAPELAPEPEPAPEPVPEQNEENKPDGTSDDIGEVLPDHWSGTVPVFKPTMHQFKDFKRFVRRLPWLTMHHVLTCNRWKRLTVMA